MKNLSFSKCSKLLISFAFVLAFSVSSFAVSSGKCGCDKPNHKCICMKLTPKPDRHCRIAKKPQRREKQNMPELGLIFVFISNLG